VLDDDARLDGLQDVDLACREHREVRGQSPNGFQVFVAVAVRAFAGLTPTSMKKSLLVKKATWPSWAAWWAAR